MSPIEVTGNLTAKPQRHELPTNIENGGRKGFNLGKDVNGELVYACFRGEGEKRMEWGLIGLAATHEGGSSAQCTNSVVGQGVEVRITNPITNDYVVARLVASGKERG